MLDLGLQAQAERHFGYLESEMGYRRTESTPSRIRFESPTVFVELVYDGNRSYELGLLVGRVGSQNPPFTIDEILRLRGALEAKAFSLEQVTTRDALDRWLEELAGVLRTFGSDFIAGDESSFVEIEEQRQAEVANYAIDRELRAARAKVEVAWRKKDYASVVQVLQPLRAALTKTEIGKLEFAENQTHRPGISGNFGDGNFGDG